MRKRSSTTRDERTFAALYERHRAGVLAVCMGVLGSRHDAEDASQEAFAALAVALRVDPPRDTRARLARVARNASIDLIRQRRPTEHAGDALPDRAAAFDATPSELQSVLQGIRELPEAQRTALLMRELAGHSYREIGSLLEIDEDAVRGLIARARIGLRDHREASELPCVTAREAIAAEPSRRPRARTVRRHVRSCSACQAYMQALRDDARVLRGLLPFSGGGIAGGGALVGGLGAKGALLGGALAQVGTGCAVSVCAVGSLIVIAPGRHANHRTARPAGVAHSGAGARTLSAPAPETRRPVLITSSAATVTGRSARGARFPTAGTSDSVSAHRVESSYVAVKRSSDPQVRWPSTSTRTMASPARPGDASMGSSAPSQANAPTRAPRPQPLGSSEPDPRGGTSGGPAPAASNVGAHPAAGQAGSTPTQEPPASQAPSPAGAASSPAASDSIAASAACVARSNARTAAAIVARSYLRRGGLRRRSL